MDRRSRRSFGHETIRPGLAHHAGHVPRFTFSKIWLTIAPPKSFAKMDRSKVVKAAHPVASSDAFAIALAQADNGSVITGDNKIRRCGLVPLDWAGA